jgi:hypothetical protein
MAINIFVFDKISKITDFANESALSEIMSLIVEGKLLMEFLDQNEPTRPSPNGWVFSPITIGGKTGN